jgi:hypothetical protein
MRTETNGSFVHSVRTLASIKSELKEGAKMRHLVLFGAFLMAIAIGDGQLLRVHGQQTKTAINGPYTAARTVNRCTSNECKRAGCASCVKLQANLSFAAQIIKIHCWTNAGYPDDLPQGQFQEVACGADVSWSIFNSPVTSTTSNNTVVATTHHNRSHNRERDVKLAVDYR